VQASFCTAVEEKYAVRIILNQLSIHKCFEADFKIEITFVNV
jgi:hypothetical protein